MRDCLPFVEHRMKSAFLVIVYIFSANAEDLQRTFTKNPNTNNGNLMTFSSSVDDTYDYNSYADKFLRELSYHVSEFDLRDGFGHFTAEVSNADTIVGYMLSDGIMGVSDFTRLGDVTYWQYNDINVVSYDFDVEMGSSKIKYSFNLLIDDNPYNHNGQVAAGVGSNTIHMQLQIDYDRHDWYAFGATFEQFQVTDGNVTWSSSSSLDVKNELLQAAETALEESHVYVLKGFTDQADAAFSDTTFPPSPFPK